MCKMISSESIIGNFLLAALEKGDDRINVDKLFMFESLLGSNLNHLNYFTCFLFLNDEESHSTANAQNKQNRQ